MRGFFAVGIDHTKTEINVGSLWRTADLLGAAFVFTVAKRYREQASDTLKSTRRVPCFHFETVDDLVRHLPNSTPLIGVELDRRAQDLVSFDHPERGCYLLGSEDNGLPESSIARCHKLVRLPGERSMNVSAAGAIVLWDRVLKGSRSWLRSVA